MLSDSPMCPSHSGGEQDRKVRPDHRVSVCGYAFDQLLSARSAREDRHFGPTRPRLAVEALHPQALLGILIYDPAAVDEQVEAVAHDPAANGEALKGTGPA